MRLEDKVVVVTGGAGGIGRALVERFARERPRHIAVADLNLAGAQAIAERVGGSAHAADVSREEDIQRLVRDTEALAGPIDLFCSNAGVIDIDPDLRNAASATNAQWARAIGVNLMAHVYAARAVLPSMIARRDGYLLNVVSAAGLLSQIGSAAYSASKHAALGFAESLAIAHRDDGVRVSAVCPQAVRSAMTEGGVFLGADVDGMLSAEAVAETVIQGVGREDFLILPHPQVADYLLNKATDYNRWIGGMAKLRRKVLPVPQS
jgi:NAD(P)-dependent dehydrogenase (short-subunit alcohol dehydrogenase family)